MLKIHCSSLIQREKEREGERESESVSAEGLRGWGVVVTVQGRIRWIGWEGWGFLIALFPWLCISSWACLLGIATSRVVSTFPTPLQRASTDKDNRESKGPTSRDPYGQGCAGQMIRIITCNPNSGILCPYLLSPLILPVVSIVPWSSQ